MPFTVSTPSDEDGDGNRVTDTITLKAYSGEAGNDNLEDSMDIDVLDIHMLPAADAITAVARRTRTATKSRRLWKAETRSS